MLSKSLIEDVLTAAVSTGGDFAEIFAEDKNNTNLTLVGGKLEKSVSGKIYGIGIRIFKGFNYLYAYTNNLSRDNLIKVAKEAASTIKGVKKDIILNFNKGIINNIHPIEIMPDSISKMQKVDLMKTAYEAAKSYDSLISQVKVQYLDEIQNVLIANTEGRLVEDKRIRTRILINSVAAKDNVMQTGLHFPGAQKGYEFFNEINVKDYAEDSARMAKTMLMAEYCPSGRMPVIINNGFGGVLFHESCGHGLEATRVAKNTSVFSHMLDQEIASQLVTAIDDGTIPNQWGSCNIDDEGNNTRKNILIENGILKNYMIDKFNGRRMNMEPTGSGRRESYKYAPTSRMTNTYIASGKSTIDDIIANTEYGLFAKYLGGGSVNPSTGEFNFAVREGYIVKNGKINRPVRGATLIGTGMEVLEKIDMVGDNVDFSQGICGSISGGVPVNVGQPTLRVSEMTVGGRDGER
ncbi:regulatory protease [Vallitalea longa]|uniref:Regulatory protease n=1 Tax=Vallitalea longa TaxID=2936439 RepID=A0A9W5YDE7_9FIRM|nr:TldD/PmbA family protein [Vallitalea longa]GKX29874.1 regulatory protease [Vallitalea longa]